MLFRSQGLQQAQRTAREWAVIKLWEAGHLSTRAAAKSLELTYYDYIDLLGVRGVPVVREMSDNQVIHDTLEQLQNEGRIRP